MFIVVFDYVHCNYICFVVLFCIFCDYVCFFFFFQAEDGIRDIGVTGVQTCALPIWLRFSSNLSESAHKADVLFIAVNTPQDENGSANLSSVAAVARSIGRALPGAKRSGERRVGKECRSRWSPYH